MSSGSAAGAVKSRKTLAVKALRDVWLRAGDFHDVQAQVSGHQQDGYTVAAVFHYSMTVGHFASLTEESIHGLPACLGRVM